MAIALQSTPPESLWAIAVGSAILFLALVGATIFIIRRALESRRDAQQEQILATAPGTQNPSAFMTASMQGVILRLREQEKELERLHRSEKERAAETERFSEEVTRYMPAGLLVINATGIITNANPAAELTLGARGLAFRRYSEALGEKSDLTRLLAECLATGKIFRREEVKHVAPGDDPRQLGVTISPIRRGEGKINGAICLLSDLTELASLQQQVQLKENLAALGELSAGIAHEFKNALATISGYAQMIQSEGGSAEVIENAARILEQTRNITHVVTEFLKYARPLDISSEPVSVQAIIERITQEVAEAQPDVRIRFEGAFGWTSGDEGLLRQAFLNLARNAAEACASAPNGGKVLIRGEMSKGESGLQRVIIFDNGSGITPAAQAKLFRPFFTTKPRGTGLGLAVVQKIVIQHGGRVDARNRPEGGAAFIVTLPLSRSVPEAVESMQRASQ
ncbi:MAG TPA: ATP-binding protein [Candidatus Acidoferrales bacterium]|nr:ATP-binding protein [Candidatus Acidoferrales bacterium]